MYDRCNVHTWSSFSDGGQFECVRMGGRQDGIVDKSLKLELGNKFDALSRSDN